MIFALKQIQTTLVKLNMHQFLETAQLATTLILYINSHLYDTI